MSPAPTDPRNRRRLVALIAAGIVLLLLASVGVYGLLTGPRTSTSPDPDPEPGPTTTAPPTVAPSTPRPPRVPAVPRSADPETFAQGVASTLFAWDTARGCGRWTTPRRSSRSVTPAGTNKPGWPPTWPRTCRPETPGSSCGNTPPASTSPSRPRTSPTPGPTPSAQAQPGQLAAGTTAVTIEGTRHRAGVWNGQPVTSEHPVAFTVFVVCAPTYPTCHLLRLSQLDNPLR
jgi:hypothetical protein